MKNTSANMKQTGSQNPTQNMRYTTKCMTQSALQKKIVNLIQQACDKVVEAMDIIDEVGAIAGIDVHFERCVERDEQNDHQGKHTDVHNKSYEADESYEADDIDEFDEASDEIKEVTLPELADMVAERTCFKPECTLCVLNTAFDIMDEQKLMLDLGTISADTSEEDTEGMDTEDDETYAECGCRDCDNCAHYDDCYGKSDSEYDESSCDDGDDEYNCKDSNGIDDDSESYDDYDNDGYDGYNCGDYDELATQPTRNTRNSRNASRSGREWLKN